MTTECDIRHLLWGKPVIHRHQSQNTNKIVKNNNNRYIAQIQAYKQKNCNSPEE